MLKDVNRSDYSKFIASGAVYKNLSKNREKVSVCFGNFFQCENACFLCVFYFQAQNACQMCKLGVGMGVR